MGLRLHRRLQQLRVRVRVTGPVGTEMLQRSRRLTVLADRAADELEGSNAREILRWSANTFGRSLVVAVSMSDAVLLDLASDVVPGVDVLFVNTGYHFPETLAFLDLVASRYAVNVVRAEPVESVAEHEQVWGRLYASDPDRCCAVRKVEPFDRALGPYQAWVSGVRRVEAATRRHVPVAGVDPLRDMVKLNPLATWTDDDVAAYTVARNLPEHPLRPLGFLSIGCAPCTRAVADGEDPRAGRWPGFAKTECGLHPAGP